jgi:hypothetical protein
MTSGDLSPTGEELAQGKADDRAAVPWLLELLCQLCGNVVQGGDMFVLELDRHLHEAVLMLAMLVPVMRVAAVFIMLMLIIHLKILPARRTSRT